jgi:glycosyltransferase involved in cell wall biosynthesis
MKKGISVILCTFNGAARLPNTIDHLAAQKVSVDLDWELIVVDNASTDGSSIIVKSLWEQCNINPSVTLSVGQENTPGKLFAFQKGISLAKYEYFIICDDDNWLQADYVQTAFDILEKNKQIGAVGGQAFAATTSSLPDWFEAVQEGYAVGTQARSTGDVTSKGMLWGAGLSSRTQLYKDMYNEFPSLLINKNDHRILTAEDSEYCLRLVLKGYRLYYDSRLSLRHYIPDGRLTLTYKNSLFDNFKKANLIIDNYFIAIKYKLNISLLNRIRLTLITPIRYLLSSTKQKKSRQRVILCYLFPFIKPDHTTAQIKAFMTK